MRGPVKEKLYENQMITIKGERKRSSVTQVNINDEHKRSSEIFIYEIGLFIHEIRRFRV